MLIVGNDTNAKIIESPLLNSYAEMSTTWTSPSCPSPASQGYVDGPRINLTWRWTVRTPSFWQHGWSWDPPTVRSEVRHTPRCPLNRLLCAAADSQIRTMMTYDDHDSSDMLLCSARFANLLVGFFSFCPNFLVLWKLFMWAAPCTWSDFNMDSLVDPRLSCTKWGFGCILIPIFHSLYT